MKVAELQIVEKQLSAFVEEFASELGRAERRHWLFVAQIPESHGFWPATVALEERGNPGGRPRRFPMIADPHAQPLSAKAWRKQAEDGKCRWQKVTLALRHKKTVAVAAVRIRETTTQAWRRPGPERWLLIERHRDGSYTYYLSNAPLQTSVKQIVGWAHHRWKIEQGYQQLKEELGLDHFEGRSWRGLHHHLPLCFLAYGFLQLLRQTKKRPLNSASPPSLAQRALSFHPVPTVSGVSCGDTFPLV